MQPFCEKESEFNLKNGVDSAIHAKNAESDIKSQNLNRDSSLTLFAHNDKTMDCHDFASQNLAMTDNNARFVIARQFERSENNEAIQNFAKKSSELKGQNGENLADSAIQIKIAESKKPTP
ncbi:hypothetical protein [Helicobacter sp. 23-1045]